MSDDTHGCRFCGRRFATDNLRRIHEAHFCALRNVPVDEP